MGEDELTQMGGSAVSRLTPQAVSESVSRMVRNTPKIPRLVRLWIRRHQRRHGEVLIMKHSVYVPLPDTGAPLVALTIRAVAECPCGESKPAYEEPTVYGFDPARPGPRTTLFTATTVAAAAVMLAMFPGQAHAAPHRDSGYDGDTRHCVIPREVWIASGGLTRPQVERRLEMTDRGVRKQTILGPAWTYQMCDGDPRVAFVKFEPGYGAVVYGISDPDLVAPLGS